MANLNRLFVGLVALVLISIFSGCKRWPTEYAGVKAPKKQPYTLALDPHSTSNRPAPESK